MKQIIGFSSFDESIDDKLVIKWINSCFFIDPSKQLSFASLLLALNSNSLGIKYSEPPFNVNKKFTEKYIKELFNLSVNQIESLSAEGIKQLNPKILHIFIESGHNLRDRQKIKECNPFFKIFLKTYCRDDRILWTSEPFISNPMKNTANPKWETRIDVEVPDSLTHSSHQSLEKIYRQELEIEVWSKNSVTGWQRLTKLCTESNQYLGSVYLKIGKRCANENFFTYCIPSKASLQRLALSNDSIGSVTLKIIWGRQALKGQHQTCINHHILLYTLSFKWHLNELNSAKNKELLDKLMTREELTHLSFFYMPALSLHNQHQIQSNLASYEDCMIRRTVLANLVIEFSKQNNHFSILLAKLLANEDIKRKGYTTWLSDTYIQTLDQIEKQFVLQLFENIKSYVKLLVTANNQNSQSIRLLFYCLKTLRKYHRKYRDLNLKLTINQLIEAIFTDYIKENIIDVTKWSQIILFLTSISEQLREYWYRLDSIIDSKAIDLILFDLKRKVKHLIEIWKTEKKSETKTVSSHEILDYFLFITEFNEFFPFKNKMSTSTDYDLSELHSTDKDVSVQEEEEIKPIEKYLKQIRANESKKLIQKEIKLSDLKFSSFLRPEVVYKQDLWKDFDNEIFEDWIKIRVQGLQQFANKLVSASIDSIKNGSKECVKDLMSGKIATKFFFNAISQLVYFSLAIAAKHYWNYKNFRLILKELSYICFQFCSALRHFYSQNSLSFTSNNEDFNQSKDISLALFCLNTLNVMKRIHLKTDLIELMTDMKAPLIHKLTEVSKAVEKSSVANNPFDKPIEIFRCCEFVVKIANEIEGKLENKITEEFGAKIVQQLHEDITDLIQLFPNESLLEAKYQMIEKSIKAKIEVIIENLNEKQTICDIIVIIRTKGEQIFINQMEYVFDVFKSEKEDKKRKEQKIRQTIDLLRYLAKKYNQFNELMISFESELSIEDVFQKENYTKSEKFNQMSDYIHKSIETTNKMK